MAVLAYPFPWVARAIGFASFGGIATVPEGAWVVLVPELRDQILDDLSAVVKAGYTDPRFRYTAIGALEPMVKDPEVQLWLGHLAQNDPEPKLAERAGQLIGTVPPATTTPPAAPLPGKR